MKKKLLLLYGGIFLVTGMLFSIYPAYYYIILSGRWSDAVIQFILHPEQHQNWVQIEKTRCNQAPFMIPTRGYIGYLWDISFKPFHRHQGIDIFGGTEPGITPVYAVIDGYLTRKSDWKSSLILRVPQDPLDPDRQIWVYYTHIANPDGTSLIVDDFPAGTDEVFIKAGTLLGYQGNYSGTPGIPTGVHLHISIVKDDDSGHFLNEIKIKNTIDPSPYFGLPLNAAKFPEFPILCQ